MGASVDAEIVKRIAAVLDDDNVEDFIQEGWSQSKAVEIVSTLHAEGFITDEIAFGNEK